ncbi:Zn-dependent exopeptidase [Irpex rosettiformis]|uniref:Zn-dependent exopeptidase n=1 Tax=Irpex rosettiformis TaxID=378272 RepID=A0ACB8TU88_9APHY|nr:Zn-dependent exopeptidase [Irpex rosettiformis]
MIVTDLYPLVFWAIQQAPLTVLQQSPCLSFYGSSPSGKTHFFGTSEKPCIANTGRLFPDHPPLYIDEHDLNSAQLVWLEHDASALDASITSGKDTQFGHVLDTILELQSESDSTHNGQEVMRDSVPFARVLHADERSALVRMEQGSAQAVDLRLPPFWKSVLLPQHPMPLVPVPSKAIKRVQRLLDGIKYDAEIGHLVNTLSTGQMKKDIEFLTGEDPNSPIVSRHSFSEGVRIAANWIKERVEETGATCELKPFLTGFGPNVICSYPSTAVTNETVLLSAHYDSRGSFGSLRAPGGDDDGSGTIAILAIARAIAKNGIKFKRNVQLCTFAGEEQGLIGSRAYAGELREAGADLTLMVQADMLAYHKAGEPPQLGLPDVIGTTEVTQLVANLSAIYSPELKVGFTPACCSDHQASSFHQQGFPATQVFERAGPIADPMYHNSGDLSNREGYDFNQVKSIAKVQFATLLHAAGFETSQGAS